VCVALGSLAASSQPPLLATSCVVGAMLLVALHALSDVPLRGGDACILPYSFVAVGVGASCYDCSTRMQEACSVLDVPQSGNPRLPR